MIVLDTNVLSEPLKPQPSAAVLDWLDAQAPGTLYLSAITVAELLAGICVDEHGVGQAALRRAFRQPLRQRRQPVTAAAMRPHDPHALG